MVLLLDLVGNMWHKHALNVYSMCCQWAFNMHHAIVNDVGINAIRHQYGHDDMQARIAA